PVLGLADRRRRRTDELDPQLLERPIGVQREREVERGLSSQGGQHRIGLLASQDASERFGGERLDIRSPCQLGIGHDRGRIRVDESPVVAARRQRLVTLSSRVVELAGLTDDDGPRTDDEDSSKVVASGHDSGGGTSTGQARRVLLAVYWWRKCGLGRPLRKGRMTGADRKL